MILRWGLMVILGCLFKIITFIYFKIDERVRPEKFQKKIKVLAKIFLPNLGIKQLQIRTYGIFTLNQKWGSLQGIF